MLSENIIKNLSEKIEESYLDLNNSLEQFKLSRMSDLSFIMRVESHLNKLKEIAAESRTIAQSTINIDVKDG